MKWTPTTELQFLKGVGPKFAEILRKKGLYDFKDLVEFYPRTYQDFSHSKKISELSEGENASLSLRVLDIKKQQFSRSKSTTSIIFTDGTDTLEAKFFKSPYRGYFNQFEPQAKVQVSGKVKFYRNKIEFIHPDLSFLKDKPQEDTSTSLPIIKEEIQPIYPESERLNQKKIKSLIKTALDLIEDEGRSLHIKDNPWTAAFVPQKIKEKYKLMNRWTAIKSLHYPSKKIDSLKNFIDQRTRAHLSLIFEELFILELLTALRKSFFQKERGIQILEEKNLKKFISSIPFNLTADQEKTLYEIKDDLKKEYPMHRLVQGDVGSGKTILALASAYMTIQQGYQVALMAPTEILAQQHLKNALDFLGPLGVNSVCVTGKLKASTKKELDQSILSGEAQLIIGTHALFEDRIKFKNLALVIIDEQHRFGVHQRQKIKNKGLHPHFLVMTATPIPRTLTMTVYGDLDVSIIKTLPPGRKPIKTKKYFSKNRFQALNLVKEELSKGRQAYFVFPLVTESESLDLKSAEFEFKELTKFYSNHKVGLLHGKMKPLEKETIMTQFRENKIQVLVSTTVIEVGVDVKNATIMVIENCERFGLSQLHQLRGRIGRGTYESQCLLILGNKLSKESLFRADVMTQTTDGFKISEEDLKLRGPGEILGVKQSGLPEFKLADLMKHQKVLIEARKSAFEWVKSSESKAHLEMIKLRFSDRLKLINIS